MLADADIDRCFASEYVTARQQFLDRAERMDLIVESIPISKKGPHEETLSTDYLWFCLLYTSPSPRDLSTSRMPSSA